jgi:large subunit ribosomal protein L22
MSVTIKQRFVHMTARKLRLVADTVRGKSTDKAIATLAIMPRAAAEPIQHAVKSAVSAAKQGKLEGALIISAIFVDEGPALKRRILKSRGRASRMEHRMSHITVTVDTAPEAPQQAKKAKKES